MKLKVVSIVAMLAYLAGGAAIMHNVTIYRGANQVIGATWGTVAGCELEAWPDSIQYGCFTDNSK